MAPNSTPGPSSLPESLVSASFSRLTRHRSQASITPQRDPYPLEKCCIERTRTWTNSFVQDMFSEQYRIYFADASAHPGVAVQRIAINQNTLSSVPRPRTNARWKTVSYLPRRYVPIFRLLMLKLASFQLAALDGELYAYAMALGVARGLYNARSAALRDLRHTALEDAAFYASVRGMALQEIAALLYGKWSIKAVDDPAAVVVPDIEAVRLGILDSYAQVEMILHQINLEPHADARLYLKIQTFCTKTNLQFDPLDRT